MEDSTLLHSVRADRGQGLLFSTVHPILRNKARQVHNKGPYYSQLMLLMARTRETLCRALFEFGFCKYAPKWKWTFLVGGEFPLVATMDLVRFTDRQKAKGGRKGDPLLSRIYFLQNLSEHHPIHHRVRLFWMDARACVTHIPCQKLRLLHWEKWVSKGKLVVSNKISKVY